MSKMQFGPEWMRPKTQATSNTTTSNTSRSGTREPESPPTAISALAPSHGPGSGPGRGGGNGNGPSPTSASNHNINSNTTTYSALVTPAAPPTTGTGNGPRDASKPFCYTREDMLRIYTDGGGPAPLGLEFERWEGVVREAPELPMALVPMNDADKKLFSGPMNSEIRRRQNTDPNISPLVTQSSRFPHSSGGGLGSPLRERFADRGMLGRRDTGPRKLSISSGGINNGALASPREGGGLPSPRIRTGFDGVLASGGDSWHARRRTSDATRPSGLAISRSTGGGDGGTAAHSGPDTAKKDVNGDADEDGRTVLAARTVAGPTSMDNPGAIQEATQGIGSLKIDDTGTGAAHTSHNTDVHAGSQNLINNGDQNAVPGTLPTDVNTVEWSYIDPQGNIQGPFAGSLMQTWHEAGYFTHDLRMKRIKHDAGWTTVGDMLSSAPPDTPVFLLPPPPPQPVIPPGLQNLGGLGHSGGAGAYTGGIVPQEASRFRQTSIEPQPSAPAHALPYQPIARGGRNVALETFSGMGGGIGGPGMNIGSGMGIGTGAGMHTPSESPASSFTGARFGNGSPDPMAFGGRAGAFGGPQDPMMGSSPARYPHMGGFADAGGFPGGVVGVRRSTFDGQHGMGGMGMGGGGGWGAPGDHSHTASPVITSGFGGINGSAFDHHVPNVNLPNSQLGGAFGSAVGPTYSPNLGSMQQQPGYIARRPGSLHLGGEQYGDQSTLLSYRGATGGGYSTVSSREPSAIGSQIEGSSPAFVHAEQHQHAPAISGPGSYVSQAPLQDSSRIGINHPQVPTFDQVPIQTQAQISQTQTQVADPYIVAPGNRTPSPPNRPPPGSVRDPEIDREQWAVTPPPPEEWSIPTSPAVVHNAWATKPNLTGAAAGLPSTPTTEAISARRTSAALDSPRLAQSKEATQARSVNVVESPRIPEARHVGKLAPAAVPAPIAAAPTPSSNPDPRPVKQGKNNRSSQPSVLVAATNGVVGDAWSEPPQGTSLTVDNLAQHNNQQQQLAQQQAKQTPEQPRAPSPAPDVVAPTKQKAAAKVTPVVEDSGRAPLTLLDVVSQPAAPVSAAATKAPWTPGVTTQKEDRGGNSGGNGGVLSLREIQEAEEKQAQLRKAAEKERVQAAKAVSATSPADEAGAGSKVTTSWGLPTSRTGTGTTVSAPAKDATTTANAANASASPVWTSVAKPATATKKTMKEIQEEEERRKKANTAAKEKEKDSVAAAARRAVAESGSAKTPASVSTSVAGGVWSTIGSGGKVSTLAAIASSTPVNASTARPPMAPTTSTASVASAGRGTTNGSARAVPATVVPAKIITPAPKDDGPPGPSADFVKWLSDSLKGLNKGVDYDDIVAMLLSFPLDPDPSTVELISDLVYANSTTLDGRRFASEYIAKRKSDAASARSGTRPATVTATKAPAMPTSMAEIARQQPKTQTAGNEWGGFKVVNKKKKTKV